MFEGKTCLITGGTGSWGQELVARLLSMNLKEIRVFSRNEFRQVAMQRSFGDRPNLTFLVGDVRDGEAVSKAMQGCDIVFHLAALKHVPICEAQPEEAMKTNVLGTRNIIRASEQHHVDTVVDVSTDKAVNPNNFYGLTKALGERLMIHANREGKGTRFVCVRGGNVLGTNGSVVPLFKEQILSCGTVTLTHPDMTRFFLTIPDAITLLLKAVSLAVGGETFVMRMRTCEIARLAQVLAHELTGKPAEIVDIGVRDGEKLHEELLSRLEASRAYQLEDDYFVILPPHPNDKLLATYGQLPHVGFNQLDSRWQPMSDGEIRDLLIRGGFLP